MIRVYIDVPDEWASHARYALCATLERCSVPIAFVSSRSAADLCYGHFSGATGGAAVQLPFDALLYEPDTVCQSFRDDSGRLLWGTLGREDARAPDLVGGVYRLLVLLDERQITPEARDRRGIFVTAALPAARREVAAEPLVENHAAALLDLLMRHFPGLSDLRVPLWPEGKQYAVLLSHDVDAADLSAPLELANNLARGLKRRSRDNIYMAALGLKYLGRRSANPLFAFGRWKEWESERHVRSIFYVFHRPAGVRRDWDDCRSDLSGRGTNWPLLREMADHGWEFGLHPSIHVKDTPGGFVSAKRWLDTRLGRPVHGVRHHFWALDWQKPHRTHRQHAEAGFLHDSSIAWRDQPGFRAGTALPYFSFDPERGETLPLLVLPCNVMDRHVLYTGVGGVRSELSDAIASGGASLDQVKKHQGLLNLNWHQETAWNRCVYRDFLTALDHVLAKAVHDEGAWFATPDQLHRRWLDRRARLVHP